LTDILSLLGGGILENTVRGGVVAPASAFFSLKHPGRTLLGSTLSPYFTGVEADQYLEDTNYIYDPAYRDASKEAALDAISSAPSNLFSKAVKAQLFFNGPSKLFDLMQGKSTSGIIGLRSVFSGTKSAWKGRALGLGFGTMAFGPIGGLLASPIISSGLRGSYGKGGRGGVAGAIERVFDMRSGQLSGGFRSQVNINVQSINRLTRNTKYGIGNMSQDSEFLQGKRYSQRSPKSLKKLWNRNMTTGWRENPSGIVYNTRQIEGRLAQNRTNTAQKLRYKGITQREDIVTGERTVSNSLSLNINPLIDKARFGFNSIPNKILSQSSISSIYGDLYSDAMAEVNNTGRFNPKGATSRWGKWNQEFDGRTLGPTGKWTRHHKGIFSNESYKIGDALKNLHASNAALVGLAGGFTGREIQGLLGGRLSQLTGFSAFNVLFRASSSKYMNRLSYNVANMNQFISTKVSNVERDAVAYSAKGALGAAKYTEDELKVLLGSNDARVAKYGKTLEAELVESTRTTTQQSMLRNKFNLANAPKVSTGGILAKASLIGLSQAARAMYIYQGAKSIASAGVDQVIGTLRNVAAVTRNIGRMEFGTGRTLETAMASTERSRAMSAIQSIGISARSYLGREAQIMSSY
jgi:hypothetical protein